MTNSTPLTIFSTAIRQDAEGRYCLNDCWRAAGAPANKTPAEWVKNAQTKALVAEISQRGNSPSEENQPLNVINGGNSSGTYGARQLVYAYGEWISAKFHLTVLEAFDAMVRGSAQPAIPQTYAAALLEAGRLAEENERLAAASAEAKTYIATLEPIADAYQDLAEADGMHNLRDSAKQCGWTERAFIQRLQELKWVYPSPVTGRKCAYADKVKAGLMDVKNVPIQRSGGITEGIGQPMITQKGLARLRVLLGSQPGKAAPANFRKHPEPVS